MVPGGHSVPAQYQQGYSEVWLERPDFAEDDADRGGSYVFPTFSVRVWPTIVSFIAVFERQRCSNIDRPA